MHIAVSFSVLPISGFHFKFVFIKKGARLELLLILTLSLRIWIQCSGVPPCDNCRALQRECIFDESLDQRRRVAAKRTADELEVHRDLLNDLFRVIRSAEESRAMKLLETIRNDATPEEIRVFIDETLATMPASDSPENNRRKRDAARELKEIRRRANFQGPTPSFRRRVMDMQFLCDDPPVRVRAKPWTIVTKDDDFVSHLLSLYFTWDYPFHGFLDRDVFLRHMTNDQVDSEFCSPFLVNALLANACVSPCRAGWAHLSSQTKIRIEN
jgi:hypothetical protein